MPIGYHVTRLPVTIVIHNVYATHNTMVTNGLPLFSKLFWEILRKIPIGYHVTRLPGTIVMHNVYATHNTMVTIIF